ncbi:MAG: hypothetical protein U5R31_17025 [Acidimicrobiia bacterium]|nr:hypothetical protein [Acidimicrobiia bacterium]
MADRTLAGDDPEICPWWPSGRSWVCELGAPERVEGVRDLVVEGEAIRAHLARWTASAQRAVGEFEGLVSGRGLSPATHEAFARLGGVDQLHDLVEEMAAVLEGLSQKH